METPADREATLQIERLAFGSDGEAAIVEAVRDEAGSFALVAEEDGEVIGHVQFSRVRIGEDRVVALNQFLYEELGYWGNTEDYYDPRNSYLNEVLDRRTGIPITLSILYMEVGRRVGLPLEGVSFPGHFLVRLRLRGGGNLLCGGRAGLAAGKPGTDREAAGSPARVPGTAGGQTPGPPP
jgi:hypothetical protein